LLENVVETLPDKKHWWFTSILPTELCWSFSPTFHVHIAEFELSEAQRAHASAIEDLVPGLVAVKNQVSSYMDDEHFWLIYFILLMPRLNGHDFELLATCKVRLYTGNTFFWNVSIDPILLKS
jgi:hypothetical protein